jgi:hypothetical protein
VSEKTALIIKDRLLKMYGGGVVVFIAVFACITALALFLNHLK